MGKKIEYVQKASFFDHKFPSHDIDVPFSETIPVVMISGPENSITFQLIIPLFKSEETINDGEIDILQFVVINTPTNKLNTFSNVEILHFLEESNEVATNEINKALQTKYPKLGQISTCTPQMLKKIWDDVLASYTKSNPHFEVNRTWLN